MVEEWKKHLPANQTAIDEWEKSDKSTAKPNPRYQAPGFTAEIDAAGNIISFDKKGETFGYSSHLVYYPRTESIDIKLGAVENTSPASLAALPGFYAHKIVRGKAEDAELRAGVARYLNENYSPEELQFMGKHIIKNVSDYMRANAEIITEIKIPIPPLIIRTFKFI